MTFATFKSTFFNSRDRRRVIENLKFSGLDFAKLRKLIDRIETELPGLKTLVSDVISGENDQPFELQYLNRNNRVSYSGVLNSELSWVALNLSKKATLINRFIDARSIFENTLLLGNYEEARTVLDTIEKEICISFWSIEQRFILNEYQYGYERNWETRNLILDDRNDPFVKGLGNFYSMRAEKRISFFRYDEEFKNWLEIERLSDAPHLSHLVQYLRFKAHYFEQPNYDQFDKMLFYEQHASVIDKYIMVVRLSQHILLEHQFEPPPYLREILEQLITSIKDPELANMVYDWSYLSEAHKDEAEKILHIIDLYTTGNYKVCLHHCEEMLKKGFANQPELWEITVKSAIELEHKAIKIDASNSILNNILELYFNVLNKNQNTDSSLIELVKYTYVFNSNHIGLKIYSLIKEELGWETTINYSFLARLSSKFANPRLSVSIGENALLTERFLRNFKACFPKSTTITLFTSLQEMKDDTANLDSLDAPEIKKHLYIARALLSVKNFESASKIYRAIQMQASISALAKYEIVSNLYLCFKELGDVRNCLVLWVKSYMENPQFTKRCETKKVLEQIGKGKFLTIGDKSQLIELPIFFKLNSTEKVRIKQAYEQFLTANDCKLPSELFSSKDKFDKSKLIFFMKNVCVPEIMQLSKFLSSTIQVNEERISICQFLAEFDSANSDLYNTEIALTTQKIIISKLIGGIDERKIYVNTDRLKEILISNEKPSGVAKDHGAILSKDLYDRYVSLTEYSREKEYKDVGRILQVDDDGEARFVESDKTEFDTDDYDVVLHVPIFKIFTAFFDFIRDQFVFNNEYGLDAYLSSKIRHGTLPNHLRSVFEIYNLVTAQSDGRYSRNKYWDERLDINEDLKDKVQGLLADFSRQIDTISKELKDEWIQCKTEKRGIDKALFDFSYGRTELMLIFVEDFADITDYQIFIDKCIQELWARTEICLETIRSKFTSELKYHFNDIINHLERSLVYEIDKNEISELLHNINISRTEIQSKLGNISNWFRRSEISANEAYPLGTLIETSVQIIQNINPSYHFRISHIVDSNPLIKGEYHQHFIEFINILLQNMIEHSMFEVENLQAELSSQSEFEELELIIRNRVNLQQKSLETLQGTLSKIKNNWSNADVNVNQEKNSGFPKIKKILRSDLSRKNSKFDYSLLDDTLTIKVRFETTGITYEHIDN